MPVPFPTSETRRALVLPDHFRRLQSAIEPDPDRKALAVAIPTDVRQFLEEHTDFLTRHPHTRLVGSYARSTTIHGIKDVDLVVIIKAADGDPEPETVLRELFTALGGLAAHLGDRGKPVRRKQRRSIKVRFEEADFDLDVVPVWAPDGVDAVLRVPDREWAEWVETHPLGYAQALSDLNRDHAGRVVPLAKLVKHWAWVQMKRGKPKGFWLELMVFHAVNDGRVSPKGMTDAKLFRDTLAAIRGWFQPSLDAGTVPGIPDPMFPTDRGHDVGFNWEPVDFRRFMDRLDESIGWADRALSMSPDEPGELELAIALWQRIFGTEHFTSDRGLYLSDRAAWLTESSRAGTVGLTTAGAVVDRSRDTRSAPVTQPRSWSDA